MPLQTNNVYDSLYILNNLNKIRAPYRQKIINHFGMDLKIQPMRHHELINILEMIQEEYVCMEFINNLGIEFIKSKDHYIDDLADILSSIPAIFRIPFIKSFNINSIKSELNGREHLLIGILRTIPEDSRMLFIYNDLGIEYVKLLHAGQSIDLYQLVSVIIPSYRIDFIHNHLGIDSIDHTSVGLKVIDLLITPETPLVQLFKMRNVVKKLTNLAAYYDDADNIVSEDEDDVDEDNYNDYYNKVRQLPYKLDHCISIQKKLQVKQLCILSRLTSKHISTSSGNSYPMLKEDLVPNIMSYTQQIRGPSL